MASEFARASKHSWVWHDGSNTADPWLSGIEKKNILLEYFEYKSIFY